MNRRKIAFLGTPSFALNPLKELYNNHKVVLIVTQPDKENKRGKKIDYNPIKKFALEKGIDLYQPFDINSEESIKLISSYNIDNLIVVAYGQILSERIRKIPRLSVVNIHASLLPKYRGAAPIQRSIINRDYKTGISIMEVTEGLDTGRVFLRDEVLIEGKKFPQVHDELSLLGSKLILEYLDLEEKGELKPQEQDHTKATYAKKISKEEGRLTFEDIYVELGKINGLYPKPGAYFNYKGDRVKALDGSVFSTNNETNQTHGLILDVLDDGFLVNCKNGILKISEIQFPGKKIMTIKDYLRGNSIESNINLR